MINKGDIISCREQVTPVTKIFEAEMDILELLEHKPIISKGYGCVMHCHTYSEDIQIESILSIMEENKQTGAIEPNDKVKFLRSHQTAKVRISTKVPLAMEKYDVLP